MINLEGKTILVTGGSGFIGGNFINLILNTFNNVKIFNIDKMGIGSKNLIYPNTPVGDSQVVNIDNNSYSFYRKDISIWEDFKDLNDLNFDYVFNFAAESHVDRSINSPVSFITNNVIGTANLMEFVRCYQPSARVVHISTDEVYGHLDLTDPPFTEDTNLAPRSPYAASKASSDLVALSYHHTYGLDVLVTRCCNNYGPHQHTEKFIPTIINCLNRGKTIPVYCNGLNVREWIYVDDHNKSILEITQEGKSGGIYNIGSGVEMNNLEMISHILSIFGLNDDIPNYINFVNHRKGHDFRYSLISNNYNRSFKLMSFKEGIKKTVDFYRANHIK
jgi:dTDP-glucose 4,6-dehydratase